MERIIGYLKGKRPGPTLVVFGGIHGNEAAGILAIQELFQKLNGSSLPFSGSFYGLAGNLQALSQGRRFLSEDLNRIWHQERLREVLAKPTENRSAEEKEMLELSECITTILKSHPPPFYFLDLHTTSSKSIPFITINDALINRRFAACFPVPVVLGIEEYLTGPLLSYLNEEGYVSIGFESGQHNKKAAVDNAVAFLWTALVYSGFLARDDVPEVRAYFEELRQAASGDHRFYEIIHRHALTPGDCFEMQPGFRSFSQIHKGSLLALHNGKPIRADGKCILFMPLYQQQGGEGFFLIRSIPFFILKLSEMLRKMKSEVLLPLLPGVTRQSGKTSTLVVNLKWVPFPSKAIFHLMGYRLLTADKTRLIFSNRERLAKNESYRGCPWFRKPFWNRAKPED